MSKLTPAPWILYGTAWKKENTALCVEQALHAGFRGIDTANQLKHYDEARVGQALKDFYRAGAQREELFLQTKFTSRGGQDDRLPYDEAAPLRQQVLQSFENSLKHLHTDYIDSYVVHGPDGYPGLSDEDWEVWGAMEELHASGRAKRIGISNVNELQLAQLVKDAKVKPTVVQNRCYASRGWDRPVRELCQEFGMSYQGFSLLTANPFVLDHPEVTAIARRLGATGEQVVFRFASQVGMTPLTGTTSPEHMKQDLESAKLHLTPDEVERLENIVG